MRSDVPQERGATTPETPISAVSILFNGNPLAIWIYDAATLKFLDANQSALTQYGYTREAFLQLALSDIVISGSEAEEGERHQVQGRRDHAADVVQRHRRRDGTQLNVAVRSNEVQHLGRLCKLVIAEDITERWHLNAELVQMAHHDALTGLPNRVLFNDRLQQTLSLAKRDSRQFALLYLDLDRFKPVNDSMGHAAGDELLQEVAARIRNQVRESDTVARVGGDEFTVILPDIAKREEAAVVAGKIISALALPFRLSPQGQSIAIGISIGIAVYPGDGRDADALVTAADSAMYAAKQAGSSFRFCAS